jgi:hypothetical protein
VRALARSTDWIKPESTIGDNSHALDHICRVMKRIKLLAILIVALFPAIALAAGPVETSIYSVQGVEIDVNDVDAAHAKRKALTDVQVKAFHLLVERLGTVAMSEELGNIEPKEIMPYLSDQPGALSGQTDCSLLARKTRTPVWKIRNQGGCETRSGSASCSNLDARWRCSVVGR